MSAYKLDTIGKIMPLVFVVASDGVKIINHLHQVITGFKIVDVGITYLLTNRCVKPQKRNAY